MATEPLDTYRAKRDFAATPEPSGDAGLSGERTTPVFVVQEHHARALHWDFRLEHDGVLVSWAVPKGVPLEPGVNRLAVPTEDHPLDYRDFAGDIPPGEYGGGSVSIWDRGTFDCERFDGEEVKVTLHGERLEGRYVLFRTGDRSWMIKRLDPPTGPAAEPMPEHVQPMLARLSATVPDDDDEWGYEIKWDGVRSILYCEGGRIRLESRNLLDITAQYPEIRPLGRALGTRTAVVDGEIVALDSKGRSNFQRLQSRMHLGSESLVRRAMAATPVIYMVFDAIYLDGRSIVELPYEERRRRLESLSLDGPAWRTPSYTAGGGAALLAAAAEQGLEGLVAKRLGSRYEPGKRPGTWRKVKPHRGQEFVVGGYTPGAGRRADRIGALLVGYYDGGEFVYAGKVGTGFSNDDLDRLAAELAPLRRESSPFRPVRGLPRDAVFVEPRVVGEVEFNEWTRAGTLRHPSWKGLRRDKFAAEVVREDASL